MAHYEFIKLSWTDKMAFNKFDKTIRIEASDNIPWANGKWVTTNCTTRKAGGQAQVWDEINHQLAWVKTPPITFYGGLSKEEQDEFTPIIAEGITAVILREVKRNNRGKWYLEDEDKLFSTYLELAEDGCKFDIEEVEEHLRSEYNLFYQHRDNLKDNLPAKLYEFLEEKTREYRDRVPELEGVVLTKGNDKLKAAFKDDWSYSEFMKKLEEGGTPPSARHIGKIYYEFIDKIKLAKTDLVGLLSEHYGKKFNYQSCRYK